MKFKIVILMLLAICPVLAGAHEVSGGSYDWDPRRQTCNGASQNAIAKAYAKCNELDLKFAGGHWLTRCEMCDLCPLNMYKIKMSFRCSADGN